MKKSISFLLVIILIETGSVVAQHLTISPELRNALTGKQKFSEIMAVVDGYYHSRNYQQDKKLFSEYKKWNRWSWWAARHVDENGEINDKSSELFATAEAMKATAVRNNSNSGQWSSVGPTSTTWAINRGSRGIGRVDRLAIHPTNANIILAATPAGGLWRTNNGGNTWFSISSSIPNCGISGVVFSANDPSGNTIYILTGDGDTGPAPGPFVANYGFLKSSIGVLASYDGGNNWSKLGNSETVLSGKRCYKLLQHRILHNVLFAATHQGLFTSTNFGGTWSLIAGTDFTIFDIEQHPTNAAIMYIATITFVGKSTNNGTSFSLPNNYTPVIDTATRSALAVTPANPNEVYLLQCGTTNRIYRSVNSGDDYTSINTTDLITNQYGYNCAFAINPGNNNFMATGGVGIAASSDNGMTFPNTSVGNISTAPPLNYVHPDIHDLIYLPNGNLYAACDGGVYLSTNNGVIWTDVSAGLQCTQYYHIDGVNGVADFYAGGSQDNGTAFTTNGSSMNYFGSGDGFAVDFPATDNNIIYIVENANVSRYTRSNGAIVDISPLPAAQRSFYPNIISHPTNNQIVYVGYANSMWRSNLQGAGGLWTSINPTNGTSNGGAGHTGGFAVSAQAPDRLYAANATQLWRSDNQGNTFTLISGNPGWPATSFAITDIAARNNNAAEIWVTTTGFFGLNRVLYSSNAGASWVDYTGSLPNVPVYAIVCTTGGDVYAGTELGVYFMDVSMTDWVPFYNGLPMVPVSDLFVNEANGTISAGTFGRGIWRSDLYSDCTVLPLLSNAVQGKNFYQSGGVLQTKQTMTGSFGNELRYRSPVKISLKPDFTAKAGSYLHAVIGPCGQGVFNRPDTMAAKTKAEELGLPIR